MEMNIGANIKRLRNEKNITQEQLAAAMNLSRHHAPSTPRLLFRGYT